MKTYTDRFFQRGRDFLQVQTPIMCGAMTWVSDPELVSHIGRCGGFGLLAGLFALALFFGLRVRDPDCACKLFRREVLEGVNVESGGAFLSAELLIKIGERGGTFENEVLGVDLETRRIVWRYMHEDRQFPYYSSAALADGKVVLGNSLAEVDPT